MFNKDLNNITEKAQETTPNLTLGAFLKEARQAKQLELSSLAQETSLSIGHLIALEEDNRAALPADVFTRGFVKIYAARLGLAPTEAIRLFERQWGAAYKSSDLHPSFETKTKGSSSLLWPVIILIILAGAIVGGLRLYQDRQTPKDTQVKASAELAPAAPATSSQDQPATPAPSSQDQPAAPVEAAPAGQTGTTNQP